MADVTVLQFADVLKVPVEKLLAQLAEAGIKVSGQEDTNRQGKKNSSNDIYPGFLFR